MPEDREARDRIRALVRDVLNKSLPEEPSTQTSSKFIDTAPPTEAPGKPTHDESSKTVITEDDVRNLQPGATLRIGENARLTPLAADIVSDRKIEIVRRTSRRGSQASMMIA